MLKIPGVELKAAEVGNTPFNMGVYGHFTSGKTHFAAEAAKYYQEQGKDEL